MRLCTSATVGDVGDSARGLRVPALAQRQPAWILAPRTNAWLAYLFVGLAVTVLLEHLGTGALQRWTYGDQMPRLAFLGAGLSPMLQWLLVPPIAVWLTRRHVKGATDTDKPQLVIPGPR